jgi:hypothetical protein
MRFKFLHDILFFFQKKKQKAFVLLRRRALLTRNSAKPTLGVWGLAPKKNHSYSSTVDDILFFFPEKEAKSACSASQKFTFLTRNSAKPTLGVWGLAPKKNHSYSSTVDDILFFFQKKKQKAFVLLRRRLI